MSAYYLWCPDADGSQHYPCSHPLREGDHYPFAAEQIARMVTARTVGRWAPPLLPDSCHFDYAPGLTEDQRTEYEDILRRTAGLTHQEHLNVWPEDGHWINEIMSTRYLFSSQEAAQALQHLMRCTIHGSRPRAFRRRSAFYDRWYAVLRQKFEEQWIDTTDPRNPTAYGFNIWVPRRPTPRTLREVWA